MPHQQLSVLKKMPLPPQQSATVCSSSGSGGVSWTPFSSMTGFQPTQSRADWADSQSHCEFKITRQRHTWKSVFYNIPPYPPDLMPSFLLCFSQSPSLGWGKTDRCTIDGWAVQVPLFWALWPITSLCSCHCPLKKETSLTKAKSHTNPEQYP